jgi:hypothetical protein
MYNQYQNKFGIQVPKGIKNAINWDKKNGNNLREEAIKTELKQLTDYETFIVLDSGEDIPKGFPYQILVWLIQLFKHWLMISLLTEHHHVLSLHHMP